MGIRIYKPTSAGRRNASVSDFAEISKTTPEKSLLAPLPKKSGRNNQGKITMQHHGGGHKRRYRLIDFSRTKLDVEGTVIGIEYDPNRSANIALIQYADGEKRYILAPLGLVDGMKVVSGSGRVEPNVGNSMRLKDIPVGLNVHNVELIAGHGGQMCRSAGTTAQLMNKEGDWATLVLPSGEIRQVSVECRATIGQVGNTDHGNIKLGKAGRNRWMGVRPTNRGMARSHHAHPMGGGSGRSKGNRPPVSKWGTPSKGGYTRKRAKSTNKRIIRRRRSTRYGIQKLVK